MQIAALPVNETERLNSLIDYCILDTSSERTFDAVTRMAASILETPVALISLIDRERQWFKSAHGLPGVCETSRDIAFCSHTILQSTILEVTDTLEDQRFQDNPLVTGTPYIRFYAGTPLINTDGHALGTLCVIDRKPRSLLPDQRRFLRELAEVVIALLETHKVMISTQSALKASTKRLIDFAQTGGDWYWETDTEHRYTWISENLQTQNELNKERYYGKRRDEIVLRSVSDQQSQQHLKLLEQRQPFHRLEFCLDEPEGVRWIRSSGLPLFDDNGRFLGYRGTGSDITEYKRLEQTLSAEKERAQITLESIGDAVITTDASGYVNYLNPIAEQLTGWSKQQASGLHITKVFNIVNEESRLPIDDPIQRCLAEGRIISLANHTVLIDRSGLEYSIQDSAAPIQGREGRTLGAVLVFSDVTPARDLQREITYQATHDTLTDLVNRSEFESRLQQALKYAQEHQVPSVLCFLDLDQFKIVNDTCGHLAGDELLRQVALLLKKNIRNRDTLARLGGDDFGVLLERCPLPQALTIAEKFRQSIEDFRFHWEHYNFQLGISIGVVLISETAVNAADLVRAADQACYVAKDTGRNRVQLYQEKDQVITRHRQHIQQATLIQQALDENRLRLFWQPIAPLEEADAGLHYELLLRLESSDGTLLTPGAFLPAAERFQLMTRIDRWVIETALSWLQDHPHHIDSLALCTINLSGDTLGDAKFHRFVLELLDSFTVPREKICFEVTETAAIRNLVEAVHFMNELKAFGCRLALDDFGSGLSSFSYLKNLPVDFVKIDGMFVKNIANDPLDLAMVQSINDIAHLMGKKTIAEFVEHGSIASKLKKLGVDFAQGYHIGHPKPLREALFQ